MAQGTAATSGLIVKANILAGTAGDNVAISPTGGSGSFVNAAVSAGGSTLWDDGTTLISCTELSPISNSNLVRVRETIATTANSLISAVGDCSLRKARLAVDD
jgi:hypothetical protein